MYFELWIDRSRSKEIIEKLRKVCEEVWEVYYNYDLIVKVKSDEVLKIDGVLFYKRHYRC
ncbi:MAG: hypothetical protein QXD49_00145 [Archaeoglobaceae archaeon]|uniref:Uncharacterized protein n=1 Tax=Archaeoglobus fulgidus TaxID=2234 RepID=A0A7J3M439_ARCFL